MNNRSFNESGRRGFLEIWSELIEFKCNLKIESGCEYQFSLRIPNTFIWNANATIPHSGERKSGLVPSPWNVLHSNVQFEIQNKLKDYCSLYPAHSAHLQNSSTHLFTLGNKWASLWRLNLKVKLLALSMIYSGHFKTWILILKHSLKHSFKGLSQCFGIFECGIFKNINFSYKL